MSAFFMFLTILLSACLAVIIGEIITRWWDDRQEAKALLLRDIKVKDELIIKMTLENRMLHVQLNMLRLVLERKTKRGIYLASNQAG
jgi:hypothetical protein